MIALILRGLALASGLLAAAPALAQANPYSPAFTVNDSAVTHYDIAQRMLLLEALGAREDLRTLAIEQLTEDRLKIQAAATLGIELPEGAVQAGLEEFATQRGLTLDDVYGVLAARNIDRQAMDDFVSAGLYWREVVTSRYRERSLPSESDLDIALEVAGDAPVETLQVREIALPFAERGEEATLALAEQLSASLRRGGDFAAAARQFSRAATAERGGALDPVPAAALPPAIRSQVLLLQPGGVTGPIPISGGVAILKLDGIRQTSREEAFANLSEEDARNQLREQIFQQRIASFGQGYLQELLGDALIIER